MRLMLVLPALAVATAVIAQEDYARWPLLVNPFPSTGGGGVIIDGYKPVVSGGKCRTDFTAVMPDGQRFENEVEFDATETQGGVLCDNGRWRAKTGGASGTTPFRVFIKDGVVRRAP
ncbi:MAG: hypothetical protein NW215_02210 [Hyphomicrobiales bacterium]|nr:hypothetical protein [Hyphomicrobiales bacterium]